MPDEPAPEDVYYPLHVRLKGEDLRRLRDKAMADRREVAAYAAIVLEREARRTKRPSRPAEQRETVAA